MPSWKTNLLSNCLTAGWRLLSRWYSTGMYMYMCVYVVYVCVCVYLESLRLSSLGALSGHTRFIAENDLGRVPALPIRI